MTFGIYDIMVIAAILYLSLTICMTVLPAFLKGEGYGDERYIEWIRTTLEPMFIKISDQKARLIIWSSMIGVALLLAIPFAFVNMAFAMVMALPGLFLGRRLPRWVITFLKNRRVRKFNLQMVDGLTLLSNGLKAGLSIAQGLENVAKQLPDPIAQEFRLVLNEQKLGISMEEAFINLGKRVRCEDVDMFSTAVVILRETGGNLAETFDTIVHTIRERIRVQQKISAMVAQGLMQGIIIFLMPFGLGVAFLVVAPGHITPMLTTWIGNLFLLAMLILQAFGGVIIWKVIKIDV